MTTSMPCTEGAPAAAAARPAKQRVNMKQWAPYIFISPFFILFAVFSLFPLLFSIYLSFNQWEAASGVDAMQWVGLDNYKYALSDPWFLRSLGNTGWLALASGVPQHLVAIPLAACGLVTPWLAGIGMSGSSLLVVLNSLRLQKSERT